MKKKFKTPLWLIIYSDMMTNLTLFFLLAFALTRIEKNLAENIGTILKAKIAGEQINYQYELLKTKEKNLIEKLNNGVLRDYAQVEVTEKLIKLTLTEPLLFEIGSAEILPKGKKSLDEIASILKEITNTVIIEGHTDNLPMRHGSNWELSLARAINIVDYLTKVKGLDKNRFLIMGYGEYKPIVPNTTAENRARNRRVEINIVRM